MVSLSQQLKQISCCISHCCLSSQHPFFVISALFNNPSHKGPGRVAARRRGVAFLSSGVIDPSAVVQRGRNQSRGVVPDVFMSTITIFSRARMVTSLCSAPQLSSSRVLLGCRTLQRSLIYYSSSFLFHLVVCRDFYKYLNANVERKKKRSVSHFYLPVFFSGLSSGQTHLQ